MENASTVAVEDTRRRTALKEAQEENVLPAKAGVEAAVAAKTEEEEVKEEGLQDTVVADPKRRERVVQVFNRDLVEEFIEFSSGNDRRRSKSSSQRRNSRSKSEERKAGSRSNSSRRRSRSP